jgi:hypothetical protein
MTTDEPCIVIVSGDDKYVKCFGEPIKHLDKKNNINKIDTQNQIDDIYKEHLEKIKKAPIIGHVSLADVVSPMQTPAEEKAAEPEAAAEEKAAEPEAAAAKAKAEAKAAEAAEPEAAAEEDLLHFDNFVGGAKNYSRKKKKSTKKKSTKKKSTKKKSTKKKKHY